MTPQTNDSQFSSILEQRAEALFEKIQYGCCVSDLMDFLAENESQWEKRAKWIMDQHWFQSEASFRLDVADELDYTKWTTNVVQAIDIRIEQDR